MASGQGKGDKTIKKRAPKKGLVEKDAPEKDDAEKGEYLVTPSRRRPVVLVAVVVCSIIMVGSILLPSLSSIVSGIRRSAAAATAAATTAAATTGAAGADDAATTTKAATTTNSQMDSIDSFYQAKVDALEAKLQDDPDDLASLINVANDYRDWGQAATKYATSDDERAHASELLTKAMGYYDSYLALEDSSAARVSRAMCQYYQGDVDGAKATLLAVTQADGTYAPAWAQLATIYKAQGDTQAETDALNRALSVDPNDVYGVQSTVTQRLSTLAAGSASTSAATRDATTLPSE